MLVIDYEFFQTYLSEHTPSGFESKGQNTFLRKSREIFEDATIWKDFMSNGYVKLSSGIEDAPTIVLEAHIDEISWRVESIRDNYLYVIDNGGVDSSVAPGKKVFVLSSSGRILEGVFGKTAPHLVKEESSTKKTCFETKDLFIDLGLTKEEISELGILPGDPVVYNENPYKLGDFIVSKGLDNKLGGFIFLEALKNFKYELSKRNGNLNYNIILVNSVQEEIGKRGASISLNKIKPDLAIVFDVGHDTTTPGAVGKGGGYFKAGKGPMVVLSPILQRDFGNLFIDTANELEKTPFMLRPRGKITGTDADIYSEVCPTILMQVPLKYMHSSIEMVHKKDIKYSIKIIHNFLEKLNTIDIKSITEDIMF